MASVRRTGDYRERESWRFIFIVPTSTLPFGGPIGLITERLQRSDNNDLGRRGK